MGFTWVNDTSLIVSRVRESEWSNDPKKRPKPSLYYLTLKWPKTNENNHSFKRKRGLSAKVFTFLEQNNLVKKKGPYR